ncbi:MAG: hypothetical protein CL608_27275 [Anaerolineaceae bacterium]|nr:hypothetical protein [Anaerolineaceae bacterium]
MKFQETVWLWFSIVWLLAACASNEEQLAVTEPAPTATAVPATTTPLPNTPTPTATPVRETAVPTPSPLEQSVAAAAKITEGDWSPDGRYFTYWTHTAEEADVFMPGDFYIYDTEQEQSCPFAGYRTGATTWKRRHLWLPNGEILVFGDEDVVAFQPCSNDFAFLTDRFPEPITRVVTAVPNHSHFLLTSENGYWLYQPGGHQVQPVAEFSQGMDGGAAFSPDGRFVALNGDEGGSYLLDVATATVSQIAEWTSPLGLGGLGAPEWLSNTQFVIVTSKDLGPLLIDLNGTIQNIGLTFFDRATTSENAVFALRDDASGHFHLRLETFDEDTPLRLYHSEIDEHEAIALPGTHESYVFTPANEHWLLLRAYTEDNRTELWVRPIDPVNSLPQRLAAHEETIYPRAAPIGDHAAVGYSNKIEVFTLPDATLLASYAVAEQTIYPLGFSPDGRFLVLEAVSPEGGETLFILPVNSS